MCWSRWGIKATQWQICDINLVEAAWLYGLNITARMPIVHNRRPFKIITVTRQWLYPLQARQKRSAALPWHALPECHRDFVRGTTHLLTPQCGQHWHLLESLNFANRSWDTKAVDSLAYCPEHCQIYDLRLASAICHSKAMGPHEIGKPGCHSVWVYFASASIPCNSDARFSDLACLQLFGVLHQANVPRCASSLFYK
jgi:hypothetical protein